MDKVYSPTEIERRLYQRWESAGHFAPRPGHSSYCIVIPPPNVTGTLHMGHAFQVTIMDALIRVHRMRGESVLWQVGTDHAGIATQMIVERALNAEGRSRSELSREAFVERVWHWKEQSGDTITRQLRRLGASVDWTRERFTMDEGLSQAVIEAFVRLHERGLIYRGKRLVNWDPVLRTALSDLEVLSEEEDGHLWHLRYPLSDGPGHVVVATTRPETMLGDTAVAVHPEDERYRALVGRCVRLPIAERQIPIIADEAVDPGFGTGCVKITPAHDFNDYAIGARHGLALVNVLTDDARLNENAPEPLRGLDRFEARERIVASLDALGLLECIEPHKLMIPRGDRSGAVIEPYLTDQWYVRIGPLAAPAIEAVRSGRLRFIPGGWDRTYFQWMDNIQDWCISRQLWWGHRIPAWYDEFGEVYVARSLAEAQAAARARHGRDVRLRQDEDVLDTWFSSALWPFSTLGWPGDRAELERFYPTDVLVTGFDIIFFWVARMVMFGLHFTGQVPFRELYITGLIRDEQGRKMSKSKGNIIDPLDIIDGIDLPGLIDKRCSGLMQPHLAAPIEQATRRHYPNGIAAHGSDALRFTLASLATQSRDISFDLARVAGYRNFCNKLWNAARFVLLACEGAPAANAGTLPERSGADRWIRSRLGTTLRAVDEAFAQYRFDFAASALYEFTWYELCDWYLEFVKPVLHDPEASTQVRAGAQRTLLEVFEILMRLLHPLMPFITEEIWQRIAPLARGPQAVAGDDRSIMLAPWPDAAELPADPQAEREIGWLMQVVRGVRQIRSEMDISPARRVPLLLQHASAQDLERVRRHRALLVPLAGLESVGALAPADRAPPSAAGLIGELTLLVPMAGLIEPASELRRLDKRVHKVEQELIKCRHKLANPQFLDHAPREVVEQERERLREFERTLAGLSRHIEQVRAL